MILYGASGHAKVIISCLLDKSLQVIAIYDDDLTKTMVSGYPVSGPYHPELFRDEKMIIAVGDNLIRQRLCQHIAHQFGLLVHSSALVDKTVLVGEGTVIMHRAVIQADSRIGKHVIVNTMASVDHECTIADFAHIGPGAVLCGNVQVGECTLLGAGCVVVPNVSIGNHCIIAAGSIVKKDVPDGTYFTGTESKSLKRN